MFVFEGDGVVKDYLGSLSDYAETLIEQEDQEAGSSATSVDGEKKTSYKEDKAKRNERRNALKSMRREMAKIEPAIERLKVEAQKLQIEIDNSAEEGWTVLADLAEKLQKTNDRIEEKELMWLEIAEELETLEEEDSS